MKAPKIPDWWTELFGQWWSKAMAKMNARLEQERMSTEAAEVEKNEG